MVPIFVFWNCSDKVYNTSLVVPSFGEKIIFVDAYLLVLRWHVLLIQRTDICKTLVFMYVGLNAKYLENVCIFVLKYVT